MSQYNRRTIVRGAAWTIPVVAVASTAPAFAASTDAPSIGGSASFTSCKLSGLGGSNCQGYRLGINLSIQPSDRWTIEFTQVVLNGVNYTAGTAQKIFTDLATTASMVELVICTNTNSQGPTTVLLAYKATNTRTGVTTSVTTQTFDLGVVPPCK
jgi:hypothetical protein